MGMSTQVGLGRDDGDAVGPSIEVIVSQGRILTSRLRMWSARRVDVGQWELHGARPRGTRTGGHSVKGWHVDQGNESWLVRPQQNRGLGTVGGLQSTSWVPDLHDLLGVGTEPQSIMDKLLTRPRPRTFELFNVNPCGHKCLALYEPEQKHKPLIRGSDFVKKGTSTVMETQTSKVDL